MTDTSVNGVIYTCDADIDIDGIPTLVEAIWDEYVPRNPHETRALCEAIEWVHWGACRWEYDEEDEHLGHAHVEDSGFCLNRKLAGSDATHLGQPRDTVLDETVRHEMAHAAFGIVHGDERFPKALRLFGLHDEAQRYDERLQAFFEGRMPGQCPQGHGRAALEPSAVMAPYGYFCWKCSEEYEDLREGDPDEAEVLLERHRVADYARTSQLVLSNWWLPWLPHPATHSVALNGDGRSLKVVYARQWTGWLAAAHMSDGPAFGYGREPADAIATLIGTMDDSDTLLASLSTIELDP